MKLYQKLIRPMHSYPGPNYEQRKEPIEKEVKWYPEEECERLEKKYASYNEGSFSDLIFEEKFEPYICDNAIELLKEQEAVVPKYNARTNWYECGACHYSMTSGMHCRSELIPATKVRYCANCGFPVNWEGR